MEKRGMTSKILIPQEQEKASRIQSQTPKRT